MERAELGKIIKDARLAKKMTQSEVVGTFITRNMLSQIESGVAVPSIKTLEYLSKKLDISIQMLSAQNATAKSMVGDGANATSAAKASYRSGNYEEAAELAKNYLKEDSEFFDEACAIYTMSCLALAGKNDLEQSKALSYAREALLYSEKGFYACREWKVEAICLIDKLGQ